MVETDFLGLYMYAFLFGIVAGVSYDILWVIRASLFGKKLVWLTDFLATSSAGIFISVLQYNFSSGKFWFLPFLIFPSGVLFVKLTFSRLLRAVMDRIIGAFESLCFEIKLKISSNFRRSLVLSSSSNGFGLLKIRGRKYREL